MDPPTKEELNRCIIKMQRYKAAGPDDLSPALFKDGGELLIDHLQKVYRLVWDTEAVPASWGAATIVPLYKKGRRDDCSNHRGVSLTPVVTRILGALLVNRLRESRELQIREQQAGFRPGRGCIDQIFTLRRILEHRSVFRRPTVSIFLDFKGAFDSVDRKALFETLLRKGVPLKYVNILRSLYAQSVGNVRAYNELSETFYTNSGVRQGCTASPFLFNFVIDVIMESALEGLDDVGIDIGEGRKLADLEYADDIVLLFQDLNRAQ